MARFTVIYDACVLYPAPLRDLLLQLALTPLFRAKWTEQIHDEWVRNLINKHPDLQEKIVRTRQLMNEAVEDCLVSGYEYLIPSISLPDLDDRHVVAAAIHSRSDAIITFNLKDFPNGTLAQYHIEAIHPDEFIAFQRDLDEAAVIVAAQQCRGRLCRPPKNAEEYLETLRSQGLPKTVALLSPFIGVI